MLTSEIFRTTFCFMEFLDRTLPQKIISVGAIFCLVLLLASFKTTNAENKAQNENQNSNEIQQEQKASEKAKTTEKNVVGKEQGSAVNKVNISVDTNTTDGETSGSANVEITKDNETQTFSKSIDSVSDGNSFSVNVNQGKVNFDVDLHKRTVNKSEFDQEIKITSKSHL